MKRCFQCGIEKPLIEFLKIPAEDRSRKKTQHKQLCKSCIEQNREAKKKPVEKKIQVGEICWLEKQCHKCKQTKPLKKFYKRHKSKDGHAFACKECSKKYRMENKERIKGYHRNYAKKYRLKNWDKVKKSIAEYNERPEVKQKALQRQKYYAFLYPQKTKARQLLRAAVRSNKVNKPNKCQICEVVLPIKKIHGHHENYNNPYDVLWVCVDCHIAIHSLEKEQLTVY